MSINIPMAVFTFQYLCYFIQILKVSASTHYAWCETATFSALLLLVESWILLSFILALEVVGGGLGVVDVWGVFCCFLLMLLEVLRLCRKKLVWKHMGKWKLQVPHFATF